jgi:hypothetical protein
VDRQEAAGRPHPWAEPFPLPGGWLLRAGVVVGGGRGLELLDPEGSCVAAVAGDARCGLTVERAWRGIEPDEAPNGWALAVGRADEQLPLTVTFTGRRPGRSGRPNRLPMRTVVSPRVIDGLWAAAVPGLQFAVTCRQGTRECVRHIGPLPGRWPLGPRWHEEGTG